MDSVYISVSFWFSPSFSLSLSLISLRKGQCLVLLYLLEDETGSAEFNDGVYGSSIIWHHNRPDCCTQAGAGCMDMIGPLIHLTA